MSSFHTYSSLATAHGVSYVGDHGRGWLARLVWAAASVAAAAAGAAIVAKTLGEWDSEPVATNIETYSYNVQARFLSCFH